MNEPILTISDPPAFRATLRGRRQPWTAGELRAALACLPDDTPIAADVATHDEGHTRRQIVTGIDFGSARRGEGPEDELVVVFAIQCAWPRPAGSVPQPRAVRARGKG